MANKNLGRIRDEIDLVSRLRDRSSTTETMFTLYQKARPTIIGFVVNHHGTQEEGDNILHEAITLFASKVIGDEDFEPEKAVQSYIIGIAKNLWWVELRKRKKERPTEGESIPEDQAIGDKNIEDWLTEEENQAAFLVILNQIDEKCRKLLIRTIGEGSKLVHIFKDFGFASVGAARNKKMQCKKLLMKKVETKPKLKEFITEYFGYSFEKKKT